MHLLILLGFMKKLIIAEPGVGCIAQGFSCSGEWEDRGDPNIPKAKMALVQGNMPPPKRVANLIMGSANT